MKSIITAMPIIIMCLFAGCTNANHSLLSDNEKLAIKFLKSKEYTINSNIGMTAEYILDKETIKKNPYHITWGVQYNSPDVFFNKTISIYSFIVENHPLEEVAHIMNGDYSVQVNVFLSEGEVIGGTSYLVPKDNSVLFGAAYSLDGKSLEEITGLSYSEWMEYWEQKYSD